MMKTAERNAMRRAAETGRAVGPETALAILRAGAGEFAEILAAATRMRRRFHGDRLHHCSIVNARCGACAEDCAFCAQSVHHTAKIEGFALRSEAALQAARAEVQGLPVERFGVVTSGGRLSPDGVQRVCRALRTARRGGPSWCASLGSLGAEDFRALRKAGLRRFHHNLETAESFFPRICTTHRYADRLTVLRRAKAAGLQVCSGGILGMGETDEQRVELAFALNREKVDSIPLNFLIPVPGTKLAHRTPLRPLECLRAIAMFRMVNPRPEIKIGAGRVHLRDLQSMVFYAGATGIMIGRLLTTAGGDVARDVQMLRDLEADHAR